MIWCVLLHRTQEFSWNIFLSRKLNFELIVVNVRKMSLIKNMQQIKGIGGSGVKIGKDLSDSYSPSAKFSVAFSEL